MGFTVRYSCAGRLGNCVYPYTLCVIYQIMGYTYVDTPQPNEVYISDDTFLTLFNDDMFKLKKIPTFESNIVFTGYFQHYYIIKYYKEQILDFIKKNPTQIIHTASMTGKIFRSEILVKDYLPSLELTNDDIVIHLRLEDNITDIVLPNTPNFIISPYDYDRLLLNNTYKNIYWVACKPTHDIEYRYINYMINKWGGVYKEQSIEEDVCLMRKAHNIICSRSTLSIISSGYSIHKQNVFMPVILENWNHESFTSIHENTELYHYTKCSLSDLKQILIP